MQPCRPVRPHVDRHQRYSTENQADAIHVYADARGIDIVRTYADHGKNGLSIAGRHSLQRLLDDVRTDNVDFTMILVYDISRWGRFQDADESASYDFARRRAGITVEYCAEQFENDGSAASESSKASSASCRGNTAVTCQQRCLPARAA